MDRFAVVGRLHRIWSWFDSVSLDGHIKSVTPVFLDELVCHKGFSDALLKVGWLLVRNSSLELPNFDRHNGQTAKRRAENTDRKRDSRRKAPSQEPSDIVSRKKCDRCKTREEKRREEYY